MARPRQELQERKRELTLNLEASRLQLAASSRRLRRSLRPTRAAASYLRRHPFQVFGTTTAGVALTTWLLRPRSRSLGKKAPKSVAERLVKWAIAVLTTTLRSWILKRVRNYLRTKPSETDSLLGP